MTNVIFDINYLNIPFAAMILLLIFGIGVGTVIFPMAIKGLTAFPDEMLIIPRTENGGIILLMMR
jgi:hypothetical protein